MYKPSSKIDIFPVLQCKCFQMKINVYVCVAAIQIEHCLEAGCGSWPEQSSGRPLCSHFSRKRSGGDKLHTIPHVGEEEDEIRASFPTLPLRQEPAGRKLWTGCSLSALPGKIIDDRASRETKGWLRTLAIKSHNYRRSESIKKRNSRGERKIFFDARAGDSKGNSYTHPTHMHSTKLSNMESTMLHSLFWN